MAFFHERFTVNNAAVRVRFGTGLRHELAREIEAAGGCRALILSTPGHADLAAGMARRCGPLAVGSFSEAAMHTPIKVSDKASAYARQLEADHLVAIGGGSAIGLGKAIALRTGLPLIALPTTYAGSEATPILGQTENGVKTTLTDARVQPRVILYDPELVATLPPRITLTSALNAMAHAAEALYARERSPLSSLMAVEGLRAFRDALPAGLAAPGDLSARAETLYGAWLCGTVLGQVGMALHHKLCHVLGGAFNLPHADTHAVILPHAIGFNAGVVPELLAPVAQLFGDTQPGQALYRFAATMGAPLALRDLGMRRSDLERAADLASANPYWNPRPLQRDSLRALLQAAWEGAPPEN